MHATRLLWIYLSYMQCQFVSFSRLVIAKMHRIHEIETDDYDAEKVIDQFQQLIDGWKGLSGIIAETDW